MKGDRENRRERARISESNTGERQREKATYVKNYKKGKMEEKKKRKKTRKALEGELRKRRRQKKEEEAPYIRKYIEGEK